MSVRHNLTELADEPAFGENGSKNRQPYPSWWTSPISFKNGLQLETLYGFPTVSFWFIEKGGFGKFPHKKLSECKPPSAKLIATFNDLLILQTKWEKHSRGQTKKTWIEAIGYPGADFWDKNWEIWENYLIENMPQQVQFFGIPFRGHEDIYNQTSPFFKKHLTYFPGRWCVMVGLSLALVYVRKFINDVSNPFIPWDCTDLKFNSPLLSEGSYFEKDYLFDLLKNQNQSKINELMVGMRYSMNSLRNTSLTLPFQKYMDKYQLMSVVLFKDFLQNGGFSKYSKEELSVLFLRDFRLLFCFMFQNYNICRKSGSTDVISFIEFDKNLTLLYRPGGQNLRYTLDWMIWCLMCIHHDLSQTNLAKSYNNFHLPPDFYDKNITKPLFQIKKENAKEESPTPSGVHIPDWIKEGGSSNDPNHGIMIPDEKVVGVEVDFPLNYPFQYESTKTYIAQWRKKWIETATFHFLKIGESPWPPPGPTFHYEEDSYDAKFLRIMHNYPISRLRIPPIDWASFERKSIRWKEAFQRQCSDYFDWIDSNIKAEEHQHYIGPGRQLKDSEGNGIIGPDGKPLLNQYPNYMLSNDGNRGPLSLTNMVSILMIPADQTAKCLFGDDWTDFLDDMSQRIWDRIKKALKDMWDGLKNLLPDIWPYLLAIGGGLIVFFGIETYATEKIKLAAQ